ncbi:MAG: hypothetical protein MUF16_02545 [Burkholderiaceae bacterium]|jgi:hypothetical protein|nr:hypothetical protein [Burkholderiaceae bacterium]
MGGRFSVIGLHKEQEPRDYSDPGWFEHPQGTVAYKFNGSLPDPACLKAEGKGSMSPLATPTPVTTDLCLLVVLALGLIVADRRVSGVERRLYLDMLSRWGLSERLVTVAILAERRPSAEPLAEP